MEEYESLYEKLYTSISDLKEQMLLIEDKYNDIQDKTNSYIKSEKTAFGKKIGDFEEQLDMLKHKINVASYNISENLDYKEIVKELDIKFFQEKFDNLLKDYLKTNEFNNTVKNININLDKQEEEFNNEINKMQNIVNDIKTNLNNLSKIKVVKEYEQPNNLLLYASIIGSNFFIIILFIIIKMIWKH